MIISTNVNSLITGNILRLNAQDTRTRMERLSSGLRINRGADDPSGLAISKGMKAQVRGFNVAVGNCQDGVNLLQTMDGGMAEISNILQRMRDLAVRAANEATLTQSDRDKMQDEIVGLRDEITRSAGSVDFNEKHILTGGNEPGEYYIYFTTDRDGDWEGYSMVDDGSSPSNLTNTGNYDARPKISPDGTKIAFETTRDGNQEIYVMNNDGTNQVNISNNAATDEYTSWPPDSSKILFETDRDGNWEIYVMNSDGSNPIRLTNNVADDRCASWSPDGSKIAFNTNRDGNLEIYVMNSDGTNPVRLTNNAALDARPQWSPDGSRIAFRTNRDGNDEVYVMEADGSNPVV